MERINKKKWSLSFMFGIIMSLALLCFIGLSHTQPCVLIKKLWAKAHKPPIRFYPVDQIIENEVTITDVYQVSFKKNYNEMGKSSSFSFPAEVSKNGELRYIENRHKDSLLKDLCVAFKGIGKTMKEAIGFIKISLFSTIRH